MNKRTQELPLTRWKLPQGNEAIEKFFTRELAVHPLIARILVSREILEVDDARRFLSPSLSDLHNPFMMQDMRTGVDRVMKAILDRERITVFGDYDVDGITSVAILLKFLKLVHPDINYYIPDRVEEGYSLNRKALERIRNEGRGLIITVDCGISDCDEIAYARSLGMETVVLDHHEVPASLPDAVAVINTNRSDCRFPFKPLAGVGIVFNFLIALRGRLREEGFWTDKTYPNLREYMDLVALGTIGDICPLVDVNRIFVKTGLSLINEGRRVGLKALSEVSNIESSAVDSSNASFSLIPRLNAAGRIASPEYSVRLLITDDPVEAKALARRLDDFNRSRQNMEKEILSEVISRIQGLPDLESARSFVFSSDEWHSGIIGIVASKIVDLYYRPAILINTNNGVGKGSGRSISEFNLYEGLKKCQELLISYGGHRFAAGISIAQDKIPQFSQFLENVARAELSGVDLIPSTRIDACCSMKDIDHELLSQLDQLAPFGSKNPEPLICIRGVQILSPNVVGNNHLRMRVAGNGVSHNSIWFGKGQFINNFSSEKNDIICTPQLNVWNGYSTILLKLKDVAKHGAS